jgi:hypothetical protein
MEQQMRTFINPFTLTAARGLAVAGVLGSALLLGRGADAAPLSCAGSPVAPAATASAVATQAPLPTQAAIEQEVNPPGDIPDDQAFVPYRAADGGYTISMPEGWSRTEQGTTVTFADKLHTFTVEVTCASAAPTVDSATANANTVLAAQIPAFELVTVKGISLPAGPAILVQYRTNSAPDEVTGKQYRMDVDRYEIYKDGKLAVISLMAPAGSDNVDVSNLVSQSFQWTA